MWNVFVMVLGVKIGKIFEVEKDSKFNIYCFYDILIEVLNLSIYV